MFEIKEDIKCDICDKKTKITPNAKYQLEKNGWSIYCSDCADKLKLTSFSAQKQSIKIYKF